MAKQSSEPALMQQSQDADQNQKQKNEKEEKPVARDAPLIPQGTNPLETARRQIIDQLGMSRPFPTATPA